MMKKNLKTLKDFEWWTAPNTNRSLSVEVFRLKQEAIKWSQEAFYLPYAVANNTLNCCHCGKNITASTGQIETIQAFIKHFFNLTDDDLK